MNEGSARAAKEKWLADRATARSDARIDAFITRSIDERLASNPLPSYQMGDLPTVSRLGLPELPTITALPLEGVNWQGSFRYEGGGLHKDWADLYTRNVFMSAEGKLTYDIGAAVDKGTRMTPEQIRAYDDAEYDAFLARNGGNEKPGVPGYLDNLSNVWKAYRQGKVGLGDATAIAWDNTKFAYRGSQRAQGVTQMLNGSLEVGGAAAISGTGVGAVVGAPVAVHGADNIATGLRRMMTGRPQETLTYTSVRGLTGSSRAAEFVDTAIPFVGGIAAAGRVLPINARHVMAGELGLTELNPALIRTTQTTVKQQGATIPKLVESMRQNGFMVEPDRLIDVVRMPDGLLTSLDNTRILAAQRAGVNIQARVFEHADLLPNDLDYISRFIGRRGEVPTTFGDAVQNRISSQSAAYRNLYPNGSPYIGSAY